MKKLSITQKIFIMIFIILNLYFMVLKSELYESKTELIVKDLTAVPTASSFGLSLLGMGSSSQLQDSKIVEAYLKSLDVYTLVDQKFHLTQHYKSDTLDFIERLDSDATKEEVLEFYNTRLSAFYDEVSGILSIAFSHVDREKSKEILEFLVQQVEVQVNEFNRRNTRKQLHFVQREFDKAKQKMKESSKALERYQNQHLLLDPHTEATASTSMIAQLEASLLEKKIKYATMLSYLKKDNYELQALQKEIDEITRSISKERMSLTGTSGNKLNKVLIDYENLKLQLEFDIEVYKNTLIQLQTKKMDVLQETKTLSILSKPNLPDGYTYPDKPKVFISILLITLLLYGIIYMLGAIVRDHTE